ncbi:MAG: glycine--tRNA ligase subunit beta [SAR202 cluster bacterium]|nr:glycine--tRNA ligase subunit beta [SAR202 cluster bacterium]
MADFVLEIGTEEVPAGVVVPALQQLEARFRELLERERIGFSEIRTLGTPRRLVVLATGVAERQADAIVEQRGPARQAAFDAGGTPTRAAEGFARRFGLTPADLVTRAVGSAEYVFALQKVVGRSTSGVLGESLPGLLGTLTFPKFMRWGEGAHRFCRPIRWLLALLGDEVVPLEAAGVRAGRECWGHRFLPIQDGEGHRVQVASAGEYLAAVERARVVLDPAVRQRRIVEQGDALAAAEGLRIAWDPDLLHEVTYVVEFPTAFVGRFSEEYLALPRAVLVSAMKKHQRYFTVENQDGTLAPGERARPDVPLQRRSPPCPGGRETHPGAVPGGVETDRVPGEAGQRLGPVQPAGKVDGRMRRLGRRCRGSGTRSEGGASLQSGSGQPHGGRVAGTAGSDGRPLRPARRGGSGGCGGD